jgi:quercetin 2,3-dioxygenase
MKVILRTNDSRIHRQDSWKKSAYAFVPYQTHFGELCGFADDIVEPGKGFGMHGHKNMEISTVVIRGAQAHRDNTGNTSMTEAYAVQTMSAGTGIIHSEFNASDTEPFHSFQVWVYPKKENLSPRYEKFEYLPEYKLNKVLLAITPDRRNGSAFINQDAFFSITRLEKGKAVSYSVNLKDNGVYIHCAEGSVQIDNYTLETGDALGVYETASVSVLAHADSELLFVEVPMDRGIKL